MLESVSSNMIYNFREFKRADNSAISAWFSDLESVKWLASPWSQEELDAIDLEQHGCDFVLEKSGNIVAHIGCYIGNSKHPFNVISSVHVAPQCRRHGIGKLATERLIEQVANEYPWQAYVEPENVAAIALFRSMQWSLIDSVSTEQNLVTYSEGGEQPIQTEYAR